MRSAATKYATKAEPAIAKKVRSKVSHIGPPAKGMSFLSRTGETDAQFAGVLTNFYVDDDRISCRAGHKKVATCPGAQPVEHLIPYYGEPERLVAATNLTLCDAETGAVLRSGFTSNNWHWTSFSNLGDTEYTVMCNGADGVYAWDGNTVAANPTPVAITKIAGGPAVGPPPPANPAQCTVAAADIGKFVNGQTVIISGANADHIKANGPHRITSVNNPPNTFSLVGVDLTGAPGDQTTGTMTATKAP